MFLSKFIKLLGHYIRYPIDFLFLPLSILFGYFHGFIKLYAMLTLNVVSYKPHRPNREAGPRSDQSVLVLTKHGPDCLGQSRRRRHCRCYTNDSGDASRA